jgi:hypothetical protein
MKTYLIPLLAALAAVPSARAALVLDEPFAYADGPLTTVSSGSWSNHSGTALQVDVASEKVNLSQAETEDVARGLSGAPYNGPLLYASFVVNFSALPLAGAGTYFAHFKDDGISNLRCRAFATVTGAASGMFRVGVANSTGTAVIIPKDLMLGTDYTLVMRLNSGTGASTLWFNPGSEAATTDRADATDTVTAVGITTFALRQSNAGGGMGVLTLDNLKVGTAFTDVVIGGDPTLNPPFIGSIADQNIPMDGVTSPVPFVVIDGETAAGSLLLSAVSANPTLVPNGNINFGGSGSNRTVTVTPAAGLQGFAEIAVTVTDEHGNTASRSFLVIVGAPTASSIANQTTPRDTPTPAIPFTVADPEYDSLTLTATSTNESLAPVGSIAFGVSGLYRTVTITPAAGVSGNTRITVFVSDGFNSVSNSFVLTVYPSRGVDFCDTFSYPDGPVEANSAFTWNAHSGTNDDALIVQGRLELSGARNDDVSAFLTNSPYLPSGGWILYAKFSVNFSSRPTAGPGEYFAHLRSTGNSFGARVFGTTNGAPAGKIRLGIANSSPNISAVLAKNLDLNSTYTVVTRYNVGTAESKLWVDPFGESDPGATGTDSGFPFDVYTYAFRQSSGIGVLTVDDLKVGTAFSDVVSPTLRISASGEDVQITWSSSFANYVLQATDELVPANWLDVNDPIQVQGDKYVVTYNNTTGHRFFRMNKL